MNQNELSAKNSFRDKALGRISVQMIENMISAGTPDSMCINRRGITFWLEYKHLEEWPKRPDTHPLKRKFEKGQLPFMRQWISWRGNAFVLLKAAGEYYLLDPKGDIDLDKSTTNELKSLAICTGLDNTIKHLESL